MQANQVTHKFGHNLIRFNFGACAVVQAVCTTYSPYCELSGVKVSNQS